MNVDGYIQKLSEWFMTSGLKIVFILFLAALALKTKKMISTRLLKVLTRQTDDLEVQKRTQTLGSIVRYTLNILILVIATMMIMKEVGIEIGPLLAAAGIAGLAIGFGAQSLVKDVISGFFILLEDQIRVGDVIQIAGKS